MAETEREYLERIAGSKIVPYEMKKEALEARAKQGIYQQAIESGLTEEQARQKVAQSGIGSVTPNLDRWAAQSGMEQAIFRGPTRPLTEEEKAEQDRMVYGGSKNAPQSDLGRFKTYGDKSAFEAKNAVRKLQGLPPIPEPLPADQQFLVDLEKSASFGAESALVGDKALKGQARAFEAGIRAGYSPEETRKLIADTAARITGIVDQRKEEQQPTTPTPQTTPKSPAQAPFFEQVYNQFRSPTTPAAVAATQTAGTPKSPAQQPFFESVYNQFSTPTLEELDKKNTGAKATFTPLGEPIQPRGLRALGQSIQRMRTPQRWLEDFMKSLPE